ncbi:hypothetical protein [Novosphingobium colocasiae]|uniref:hypothetical protein n=1 Tax=Novosphingobium colocasiae TaxID=1256513 RepID=UPI0035AF8963
MTQQNRLSALRPAALALSLATLALAGTTVLPAFAEPGNEQASARSNVKSGGAMKIGQIESVVLPKMKGYNYIGFTYFPIENIYRLRFLNGIRAVDVDVDARNGRILSRSN